MKQLFRVKVTEAPVQTVRHLSFHFFPMPLCLRVHSVDNGPNISMFFSAQWVFFTVVWLKLGSEENASS